LQSLAPTNPHWARVVGYGPFSLCLIHKEGLCPSSGDINRLMMNINRVQIIKLLRIKIFVLGIILSDTTYLFLIGGLKTASTIFLTAK
jgi:hypothetical protein